MPNWCTEWKKDGTCKNATCEKVHYIAKASQRVYFKTRMCDKARACTTRNCTNAHFPDEVRCRVYAENRRCDDQGCIYLHIGRADSSKGNVISQDAPAETVGDKPKMGCNVQYVRPLKRYNSRAMAGVARCKAESKRPFDPPRKVTASMFHAKKVGDLKRLWTVQLEIEEGQMHHDVRSYDLESTTIRKLPVHGNYSVPCPGLSEQRPSVLRGDAVMVRDLQTNKLHKGYVNRVLRDAVQCHFKYNFTAAHPVHVIFTAPRGPILLQYRGIEEAAFTLVPKLLHPNTVPHALIDGDRPQVLKMLQRAGAWDALDDSQRDFVAKFFRSRSAVNMLHGPPGTGKTTTVVAVLLAMRHLLPQLPKGFRILVCTPSNKSADLIAERMIERTPVNQREALRKDLMRVNALSREEVPDVLVPYSNPPMEIPALSTLKAKRFIVCTLCTSGKLYGVGDGGFDMLMVDEAGQCTEQELLVALCNVKCTAAGEKGRVVLAGDHKQLGPVIRSAYCREAGMNRSPLQRMSDAASQAACHTMLKHNYRAHPDIVSLYNPTYDNQLVASAKDHAKTQRFIGKFPFERAAAMALHVDGVETQDADSPSWRNDTEAAAVLDLIANLMSHAGAKPSDIVVLSGYAKQCLVLRKLLETKFRTARGGVWDIGTAFAGKSPIEVCSVEKFQGRESPIVIMSTVRSRDLEAVRRDLYIGLGFISNKQRVNVGISRPEGGLCIVGNLQLLACDAEWARIVRRIGDLRGIYRETSEAFLPMAWEDVEFGAKMLRGTVEKSMKQAATTGEDGVPLPPGGVAADGATGAEIQWHRRE